MKRLFVPMVLALAIALGTVNMVQADNQSQATAIAQKLSESYPQYEIAVAYQNGKVLLQGEVGSAADRAQIRRYVERMAGVKSVSEEFKINSALKTSGQTLSPVPSTVPSVPRPMLNSIRPVSGQVTEEYPVDGVYSEQARPLAVGSVSTESGAYTPTKAPSEYLAPYGTPTNAGTNGASNLPNYAWPTTADYPNYSQVAYPKQYCPNAFPYIGPFYPYPQVPLGWRKVTMEYHDGYWWLDFDDGSTNGPFSPLFRQPTRYR